MSLLDPLMEDIPAEVMVDILSRLPVKTIIHCKSVCKKWRNIVSDSYFVDLQFSRSPAGVMIYQNSSKLEYHNYEEVEFGQHGLHLDPVMSLDLKPLIFQNSCIFAEGSVNGLVCLRQFHRGKLGVGNYDIIICNPITREHMILPSPQYYSEGASVYCFGFGSVTREYKVIRIFLGLYSQEAEVYTLGTGKWRSLSQVPYLISEYNGSFLNGHAHWIVYGKKSPEKICAFDFDNETFELFPSPPSEAIHQYLGVLKGCLYRCEFDDNEVTIWVMKEYGIKKSWHKELVLKISIIPGLALVARRPVYIIEGCKDGTILMGSDRSKSTLFVYCPRSKTILDKRIYKLGFEGFAYRPSFHRLRTFKNEKVDVF